MFAGGGVFESKAFGVQGLTLESTEGCTQFVGDLPSFEIRYAVNGVAEDRAACKPEVDTNLVGAARFELQGDVGGQAEALQDFEAGYGFAALDGGNAHAVAVVKATAYRRANSS